VDDPILAFTDQARRYCTLIEDEGSPNSWIFAQECLRSVLRLCDLVLRLPSVEPAIEEILNGIPHPDWQAVCKRIGDRLQRDYYWQVFEPLQVEPPKPVVGSLSDDLADIWRDLKVGLLAMENHGHDLSTDVVWHWRSSFETHWAKHAAGAIGGLTALCYGEFADPNRP
jgi:hypothetical protein